MPFKQLRNPFPPMEIISPINFSNSITPLCNIREHRLDFLDPEALSIWEKAGQSRSRQTARLIDRGLLMQTIAKAPSSFTWRRATPTVTSSLARTLSTSPQRRHGLCLQSRSGPPPWLQADYLVFCKLSHMCNAIHINGGELVAMQDVNSSTRHLERLLIDFQYTDKALLEAAHGRQIPQDCSKWPASSQMLRASGSRKSRPMFSNICIEALWSC